MPQAQLDTQGPLNRRKALIARLMGQMGHASVSPRASSGGGVGISLSHINPAGRFAAPAMPVAPANPDAGPPDLGNQAPPPPTPAPPPAGGDAPPPSDPVEPQPVAPEWQSGGFSSEQAFMTWNQLDPGDQARILANPVARRRYFL